MSSAYCMCETENELTRELMSSVKIERNVAGDRAPQARDYEGKRWGGNGNGECAKRQILSETLERKEAIPNIINWSYLYCNVNSFKCWLAIICANVSFANELINLSFVLSGFKFDSEFVKKIFLKLQILLKYRFLYSKLTNLNSNFFFHKIIFGYIIKRLKTILVALMFTKLGMKIINR